MTVTILASLAGAPGVTTAATALAVHWPRPVLLIEADTSSASSIMPGFFRSNLPPSAGGIEKISIASARGVLRREDIFNPDLALAIPVHALPPIPDMPIPALPAGHMMWIAPGFIQLGIVDGVRRLWRALPNVLRSISEGGVDVIIDVGHLSVEDSRFPLLDTADRVIFCGSSDMITLNRMYRRIEQADLHQRLEASTPGSRYKLLLTKSVAQGIRSKEFSQHILPTLPQLVHDPEGAATFSHGHPDHKPSKNAYRRRIRQVVNALENIGSGDDLDRRAQP